MRRVVVETGYSSRRALRPTPTYFPARTRPFPLAHYFTSLTGAATQAPTSLLAEPAGLAELQAQLAQQQAACAYSHAIGTEASMQHAACRTDIATCTMPRVRQRPTPRHESWRARRRCAAKIGALTAQNAKLAAANAELAAAVSSLTTKVSALAAENSKLAAQCSAAVNATATSEASLQEGNARAHACRRPRLLVRVRKVTQWEY